jgi:hypothetical protein
MHGTHQYTVFQRGETQVERGQQVRVSRCHCVSSSGNLSV